jgi:membrane AbrB-like protein
VTNWRPLITALAIGGAGGAAFAWANLPLPWMLGSMSAVTVASLSGLKPGVPPRLRTVMIAVLGVMLGSAFSPELIARLPGWSLSLAVLAVAMVLTVALVMRYLRRFGGCSTVTAYFASAPGGVNEMVLTGVHYGGDDRTIALIHALRILMIVFTVPVAFRLANHVPGTSVAQAMGGILQLAPMDGLILAGCAIVGAVGAKLARFPAPTLIGPMLASAILHLSGLTASKPPGELVVVAQVVMGSSLGSRFKGLTWAEMARTARLALGSTALMVAISGGAALALSYGAGLPFAALMLAFVPGGIAEMCLVALALGQDVAFVSTHHVLRVAMVILAAPLVFRWLQPPLPPAPRSGPGPDRG